MKIILIILLIGITLANEDRYQELINEKVTDEYCKDIISNAIGIIKEAYVFKDFLKKPIQPKGLGDYFPDVDLIQELEMVNTTNRTFYDFYRDFQKVIWKARDGHFRIYGSKSPNGFDITSSYFCIPYKYYIHEIFGENNKTNETYLSIEPIDSCKEEYTQDILNKINELKGKKIKLINGKDPYDYLEEKGLFGVSCHSQQCRYIRLTQFISKFPTFRYPYKKEELQVSLQFEGVDEILNLEYKFGENKYFSSEFKSYYLKEQEKYLKNNIPFPSFDEMEKKFKLKKRLLNPNKLNQEENFWDKQNKDGTLRCRVDKTNELNVIYLKTFYPDDLYGTENIMYECFNELYKNDFKIVVILDQNPGGYSDLCIPFAQYIRPKISKPIIESSLANKLMEEWFFIFDENLSSETCKTFTEKDNILDGYIDEFSPEVKHNRTKLFDNINIFEKKIMEKHRKEYAKTGKARKPTEILIFTDGYSFSCASYFTKELQIYGAAIIAGYNIRPDLVNTVIDASQSNSPPDIFPTTEYTKTLTKYGYTPYITYIETFDFNDLTPPKVPMEFKVYPVDTIVPIYKQYNDDIYNRFIEEAKIIFQKYNNLDNGECNPNNKYLFFESEECKQKLNIDKAHGGFLCGENSKWDKTKCIAAYCDEGYILNDERTGCVINPCDSITLNEISIQEEKDKNYIIEPNNIYIFTIENTNLNYSFYTDFDKKLFYVYDDNHILIAVTNGTTFKNTDKIFINYFTNITETLEIKVKVEKGKNNQTTDEKDDGLGTGYIILIVIGSILACGIIVLIVYLVISKNKKLSSSEVEEKAQNLTGI